MSRTIRILIIMLLAVVLASCSDVQPPPPSALLGTKVLNAVRELARTYEQRDRAAFLAHTSPDLPERAAWERSIASVFEKYETISLRFLGTKMIAMVHERGPVRISANWEGEWKAASGDLVRDGGRVTLVFEAGSFLLTAIDGKDPFLPPEKPTARQ